MVDLRAKLGEFEHLLFHKVRLLCAHLSVVLAVGEADRIDYAEAQEEEDAQKDDDFKSRVFWREKPCDGLNCRVRLLAVLNLSCRRRKHVDLIHAEHDTDAHAEAKARLLLDAGHC